MPHTMLEIETTLSRICLFLLGIFTVIPLCMMYLRFIAKVDIFHWNLDYYLVAIILLSVMYPVSRKYDRIISMHLSLKGITLFTYLAISANTGLVALFYISIITSDIIGNTLLALVTCSVFTTSMILIGIIEILAREIIRR